MYEEKETRIIERAMNCRLARWIKNMWSLKIKTSVLVPMGLKKNIYIFDMKDVILWFLFVYSFFFIFIQIFYTELNIIPNNVHSADTRDINKRVPSTRT